MPKTKPSSPGTDGNGGKSGTTPYSYTKSQQIDVRTIALQLFRDQIIYPHSQAEMEARTWFIYLLLFSFLRAEG